MPVLQKGIKYFLQGWPVFIRFAIRQNDLGQLVVLQSLAQSIQIQGCHTGIAHNGNLAAGQVRMEQIRTVQNTGADMNGVAARSEERRVGKECRSWWERDHYEKEG